MYSSAHCSPEQAEQELRRELSVDDNTSTRHLNIKVDHAERHWEKNFLVVDVTQGFIDH